MCSSQVIRLMIFIMLNLVQIVARPANYVKFVINEAEVNVKAGVTNVITVMTSDYRD